MESDVWLQHAMEDVTFESAKHKLEDYLAGSEQPTGLDLKQAAFVLACVYDESEDVILRGLEDLEDIFFEVHMDAL